MLALLSVALLAAAGLSAYFLNQLEAYGLRKLEERLFRETQLAASTVAHGVSTQRMRSILPSVSPLPRSTLAVLNKEGIVVAHTAGKSLVGRDLSSRPEVAAALDGTLCHGRA